MPGEQKRIAIVFDGSAWFVRKIKTIEHDLEKDHKVYRCDKHLGGPYATLAHVPEIAKELRERGWPEVRAMISKRKNNATH